MREKIAIQPPTRDPVTYARVLLAADLPLLAQSLMIAHAKTFEIEGPTHRLWALGQEASELGLPLAATVVWRSLINSILNQGKSRDYNIGTQLLAELQDLSADIGDYRRGPFPTVASIELLVGDFKELLPATELAQGVQIPRSGGRSKPLGIRE